MHWLILWEWNDDPSSIDSNPWQTEKFYADWWFLRGMWNHMKIQTFYFPESPSASGLQKKQLFLQSQINGNEHVTIFSPWKFNIAPENIPSQKEVVFQPSFFRGYVKLREGKTPLILDPAYIPGFPQSFSISRIKSSSSLHQETPRWLWNPLARFAPSPEKKMAAKNRFWGRTHKQPTGGCRLTWHLKIKPWKRRFRTLKPSSLGSGC